MLKKLFIGTLILAIAFSLVISTKVDSIRSLIVKQCNNLPPKLVPDTKTKQINNLNLQTAISIAEKKGFTIISPELYEDDFNSFDFNVLIGMCTGSADGYCKSALFFNKDKFIGVDSEIESSQVNVIWRNDKTIALSYTLYKDSDPFCCPTGGAKTVRFEYDGSVIKPLETIPASNGSVHR